MCCLMRTDPTVLFFCTTEKVERDSRVGAWALWARILGFGIFFFFFFFLVIRVGPGYQVELFLVGWVVGFQKSRVGYG